KLTARLRRPPPLLPRSALPGLQTSGAALPRRRTLFWSHSSLLLSAATPLRSATRLPTPAAPRLLTLPATPARSFPSFDQSSLLHTDHGCIPGHPRSRRRLPPVPASTQISSSHLHSRLRSDSSLPTATLRPARFAM